MQYWLMKSEPDVWSIDQQKKLVPKVLHGMVLEATRQQNI